MSDDGADQTSDPMFFCFSLKPLVHICVTTVFHWLTEHFLVEAKSKRCKTNPKKIQSGLEISQLNSKISQMFGLQRWWTRTTNRWHWTWFFSVLDVFICGGYNGELILADLWKINLNTFQWSRLPAVMPEPAYFHCAAVTPVSTKHTELLRFSVK